MPWEPETHVDRKAATARAIAAAQPPRTDTNSAVVQSYAQKAFDGEMERVSKAPEGERNSTLFKAAANLFELVAAGALQESAVLDALRDACQANRLIQDDGESSFDKTVASARRRGFDNPRDLSGVGLHARVGGSATSEPEPVRFNDFLRLERGFWPERESLQHIYLAALSRMCSPWAVFANCVVRALAMVRPCIVLPDVIGSRGSLNFFAVVAAPSGLGKSVAEDVAADLMNVDVRQRNLGSGEGLVDAYVRPADKETGEPAGLHESVLFVADEGDSLRALGSRSGATLPAILRSAFSGKKLGFAYRGNDRHLDAHSYRLTMLVNVQPAKAGVLLDDQTGGLLQRFMWFPGTDQRIDAQNPNWPGPLVLPSGDSWKYPRELTIPAEARDLIKDGAVARNRGEPDPIDGHALFAREKLAFAIAVIDGRDTMSSDDWRLAGTVSRVSDHTRLWVTQELSRAAAEVAEKRGTERGIEYDAANITRTQREFQRQRRIANWIVDKVRTAGAEGITEGDLYRVAAGRDRPSIGPTLASLAESGEVRQLDTRPGERTVRWTVGG